MWLAQVSIIWSEYYYAFPISKPSEKDKLLKISVPYFGLTKKQVARKHQINF